MRRTFFGPTITSVFFAASLISVNGLVSGLKQWCAQTSGCAPVRSARARARMHSPLIVSARIVSCQRERRPAKLKQDLIKTWAAGLCFWPFVDLVVYSFLPVKWIPLGYNVASFFWTIFLSLQAARGIA